MVADEERMVGREERIVGVRKERMVGVRKEWRMHSTPRAQRLATARLTLPGVRRE